MSEATPMFTVVIPTYGRPAFLADALRSVLDQSFVDFECVVVDDASPEPAALPHNDPRVRLLRREENGGPPAARNTGIAAANGRYLAFLDDDDVWLPHRLADAAAAHERAPVAVCWQATLGQEPSAASGRTLEGDVSDTILDSIIPHLGTTSIERSIAPQFDERYEASDDIAWWFRVTRDHTVTTIPRAGLCYRLHDGPRSRTGQRNRIHDAQQFLGEHREWFDAHPRAKAFRLKRMGLYSLQLGERGDARRYLSQSLRLQPEPRTAWHLVRTFSPQRSQSPA